MMNGSSTFALGVRDARGSALGLAVGRLKRGDSVTNGTSLTTIIDPIVFDPLRLDEPWIVAPGPMDGRPLTRL